MKSQWPRLTKSLLSGLLVTSTAITAAGPMSVAHASPTAATMFNLGGSGWDEADSVVANPDGSYVVLYTTDSSDMDFIGWDLKGGEDLIAIKYNASHNVVWKHVYGGAADDDSTAIARTADGGYLITGETNSQAEFGTSGGNDAFLLKLSSEGEPLWMKAYGGSADDTGKDVLEASDGTYLLAGETSSNDGLFSGMLKGGTSGFLLKINPVDGTVMAKHTVGGFGYVSGANVVETPFGYQLTGQTASYTGDFSTFTGTGYGVYDMYVATLNKSTLNQDGIHQFGGSQSDNPLFAAVSKMPGDHGSFVVGGMTRSGDTDMNTGTPNAGMEAFFAGFSADGTKQWVKRIGATIANAQVEAAGLAQAPDGSYVVAVNEAFEEWDKNQVTYYRLDPSNPADVTIETIGTGGGSHYDFSSHLAVSGNDLIGTGLTDGGGYPGYNAVVYRFVPLFAETAQAPVAAPAGAAGKLIPGSTVTLTSGTPGAEIRYTTDGSAPDFNSPVYTAPIPVNSGMTLKAFAAKYGMMYSGPVSESYTVWAQPAAPNVSADDAVNTIVGADGSMEYSFDGGISWTTFDPASLPDLSGTQSLQVRVLAGGSLDGNPLAGLSATLNYTPNWAPPAAPNVTADDTANTIVGADGTMEYSFDGGISWTTYDLASLPDLSGTQSLQVRVRAGGSLDGNPLAGLSATLNYTPNPASGGGGGGGSDPSTGSTTTEITVPVETGDVNHGSVVSLTPITRTKEADGTIHDDVRLTPERAKEAIQTVKEAGQDTARIMITDAEDQVSRVDVTVPQEAVRTVGSAETDLEIYTENVRILIPQASLAAFDSDLYFRVVPVKSDSERQVIEQRARTEELIRSLAGDQTVNVVARPMTIETNMQSHAVSLILPLRGVTLPADAVARAQYLSNLFVFIEHHDGTKELVRPEAVEYKAGQTGLRFDVDKFSTFTVLNMVGWQNRFHTAYIDGYLDATFKPEADITRAEMAAILARNLGYDENTAAPSSFPDVENNHWAAGDIAFVQAAGLMVGDDQGLFRPDAPISREEMATVAARFKHLDTPSVTVAAFADVGASGWSAAAIEAVRKAGIVDGYPDGTFHPEGRLTRAESVKIVNRLFDRGPLNGVTEPTWSDVPASHWAFAEVEEASGDHFVNRLPEGGESITVSE